LVTSCAKPSGGGGGFRRAAIHEHFARLQSTAQRRRSRSTTIDRRGSPPLDYCVIHVTKQAKDNTPIVQATD